MNLDELQAQIEADELSDAEYLTPVQYGRLKGIAPQRVFYFIKVGKLDATKCLCGRRVVRISEADEVFRTSALRNSRDMVRVDRERTAGAATSEGLRTPLQEMSQEDPLEEDDDEVREARY